MSRLRRPAIWSCSLLAMLFGFACAAVAISGLSDRVAMADLVVVPGNTVYPNGSLSDRLKGRLDIAVDLYRNGHCKAILVSGGVGVEGVDESVAMRDYLVKQGVPEAMVFRDGEGANTEATARNAAKLMRERGFRTAIAATQYFHILRVRMLLEEQGVAVVGNVHARYFEARDAYSLAREVLALAWLKLRKNAA